MSGPRVMVVEDEPQLRFALRRYLESSGYSVREEGDAAGALREFVTYRPDIVLLDLMLPDAGGVDVVREIRRSNQTPIVVLSALGDEATKVKALDEGADDYLTKPFGMDELMARIRVALRHGGPGGANQPLIRVDGLEVDLERRRVTVDGDAVHLTPTEYSLLKFMAGNQGKVLTHPTILRSVWGAEYASDTAVLRTYVTQLRQKLDPRNPNRFIRTEPRVGYRFFAADREP